MVRLLLLILTSIVLISCENDHEAKSSWEAEETLFQLEELRKQISGLSKEVSTLKKEIGNIKSGGQKRATNFNLEKKVFLGENEASLGIVEFSDFQCPYCARHANKVFPEIKKNYVDTGKVKYFMYNFPLSFHAKARDAAIVAECAGKQGGLLAVYKYLFKNSRQLGDSVFNETVNKLSLKAKEFEDCRKDEAVVKEVDNDFSLGQKMGVNGTPRFLIGRISGNKLVDIISLNGAQPYKEFERVIKKFK